MIVSKFDCIYKIHFVKLEKMNLIEIKKNRDFPDWSCNACGEKSCFGSKPTCFRCGELNPARVVKGYWKCGCGAGVSPEAKSCPSCKRLRRVM